MTYRVLVQPRATAEIEEAYLWIAERAPEHKPGNPMVSHRRQLRQRRNQGNRG